MYFRPPKFIKRLFPSLRWNMEDQKSIYITFDDGPQPQITPWVLDMLSKYNAKATFFCIGKNAEQHPQIMARIRAEGHAVGNHTYSHCKDLGIKSGPYLQDVDMANEYLQTNLFRPPYGRISREQARQLSARYHIIMWDILSRDYSSWVSHHRCVRGVVPHLRGGSIVAFHDSLKASRNMRYTLPRLLSAAAEQGLECRAIEL
ncbi:MAG: polysaccharide deacetylase family protein [Mucinivorans sp.]